MVGATGKFASLILPELKQRGALVRARVQTSETAEAAKKQGADETALGNLNDEQSLLRAAEGVDAVFHINPAFQPNEAEMGVAMV